VEKTYNLDEPQGIFGSFFKKSSKPKPGVLEPPPAVLKATGSVSEREFTDIEVIKMMITSYYSVVKETVIDMVPKCIMLNLVIYAREEMQRGLLAELYKEDLMAELLQESAEVVARRRECRKMIEALQKADEIVSTV
jgi:replication fork clamp-binding protein CrfC